MCDCRDLIPEANPHDLVSEANPRIQSHAEGQMPTNELNLINADISQQTKQVRSGNRFRLLTLRAKRAIWSHGVESSIGD